MIEEPPVECPFCDFEPDIPKGGVKMAPEMEVRRVYIHVRKEHQENLDELPPHLSER
jgi:hypothetical protein